MLVKRWSMVPSSLSSSAEGEATMDLNILCDIRHPWKMQKKNSCRSNEEEKRKDLEEEEKKQGNGTIDWVQELLQKTHAAFLNRNFFQVDIFNSYGRPLDDHWSSVHMVTGWKLAVMFASYGGRLEARGLNDLIVYGRQYTLFITTSQVFSE
ncbi:uncharacterized protein [Triticum aestivum]|uniref:uncharacterized protein isoform X2 n=1 Tax=Triticum aestivum TaxID=4565 RepID=UPI001D011E24|nr:uncharacterized protein LOC123045013 isoform X2 [Triticum aestivum]